MKVPRVLNKNALINIVTDNGISEAQRTSTKLKKRLNKSCDTWLLGKHRILLEMRMKQD